MKLYNPFKAHIVQCGDKYLVRKHNGLFWTYKETRTFGDDKPHWWYGWGYVSKYCACNSLEQARALKDVQWVDPSKKSKAKMKVIHG